MAIFYYNALGLQGATKQGELQANDRRAAALALAREGLVVISLTEKGLIVRKHALTLSLFSRVSTLDLILLTRHLSSIIRAGVSIGEAIEILIYNNEKRSKLTEILEEAKHSLQEGHPLSSVFSAYPEYFPPVFIGLMKAGESSGTLEETLGNLGNQMLRDYELIRKVRSALVYPAILLMASGGIIVLLLTFVLPRLANTFGQSSVKLPILTQYLVLASSFMSSHKILLFFVMVGAGITTTIWLRNPSGKRIALKVMNHMPIAKNLMKQLALARFSRTLRNLIKSGITLIEALDIVGISVGNESYKIEFNDMKEELLKGVALADTFRKRERYFPRLVGSLVAIGERTGTLENALETISSYYDEEVDRSLRTLVTL
ncbi:MAG: type II secretion system F family protein, partial [bacterium]|nr:type II secretion system F family protein [bacterium]